MKSFTPLVPLIFSGIAMSRATVTPESFALSNFDVVIVGGGPAGLVLANRLSVEKFRVGVIDAGSYNESGDPAIDIPFGASIYLQDPNARLRGNPKYDWNLVTVPQEALGGRSLPCPYGKVLGGSSAISDMAWQRGHNADYSAWSSVFGNEGWNLDSIFPYFERAENWTSPIYSAKLDAGSTPAAFISLASVQGTDGPVQTRYSTYLYPIDTALSNTSAWLGYPLNYNPDDGSTAYVPLAGIDSSVDISTGKRSYAVSAYYNATVRARENLSVLTGAVASRLIWDNSTLSSGNITAKGVEYIINGTTYVVNVKQEVILSAGSLETPQILELSGVGNATILNNAGVPVVLDFPEIGENLQDQPLTATDYIVNDDVLTLNWLTFNETYVNEQKELYYTAHTGAFSWTTRVAGAWPIQNIMSPANYTAMRNKLIDTMNSKTLTPLQAVQYNFALALANAGIPSPLVAFTWLTGGGIISTPQPNKGYGTMLTWNLYEFSRGSVHINSSNPMASPVIDQNLMTVDWDLSVSSAATQFFDNMIASQPMASQIQSRNTPNSSVQTSSQWSQFVLDNIPSINHPLGTTAMAAKQLRGAVDSRLRVYGLANVRVVDSGVIPLQINAPPQQTTYAIAEKARFPTHT